jgi:hypothetical protein
MNVITAPTGGTPVTTTTTSVRCSPSSVTVGSHSTCTADVSSADSAALTGTLTFTSSDTHGTFTDMKCGTNNGDSHDGISTNDEGDHDDNGNGNGNVLRCRATYSSSSAGAQAITAAYSGDPNNAPSSGTFQLTVTLTRTHTALTCDPSNVQAGKSTECQADVTARDDNTLTGSVTFASSDSLGTFGQVTCTTNSGHQDAKAADKGENQGSSMTCVVDYTPASTGAQTITATYQGDASHSPSSATFTLNGHDEGGDSPAPGVFHLLV